MPAIDARYRVVNDVPSLFRLHPARFVNVGAGGQNQGGNVFRIGGCNLDANGGASMVADDRRATNAERNQELVRGFSPVFDRRLASRQRIGVAVSDRVHSDDTVVSAKKRQYVAKFVPGSRRLM